MSVIVQFETFVSPFIFPKQKDPHTQNNNSGVNVDINIVFFPQRSPIGWCIGTKVSKGRAAAVFRVECSVASEEFVYIKSY